MSNSSGLDHVGLLNPRFVDAGGFLACSSRCRSTCAFLLEDVGLLAGMSGVGLRVDPWSRDVFTHLHSRQRLLDSTGDLVCS